MALPVTTVIPFASLPSCAMLCGPLQDANGACVPPGAPSADPATYDSCFCAYGTLQSFYQEANGVCPNACPGDPSGLSSIQAWFTSFCATAAATATASVSSSSATVSGSSVPATGSGGSSSGGGDWLSTHWKWIVMLVIIVVAIVGIWVGACIWRRRYLKKKDRMYELGKGLPSSIAVNTQGNLVGPGVRDSASTMRNSFVPGNGSNPYGEKERKRWNVNERT